MDSAALLARAKRAFGERRPSDVAKDYRAIVGPTRTDDVRVRDALEALQNGDSPTPLQLAALEHAIRVFRPVVASKRGTLKLGSEHRSALPGWEAFCAALGPHLYSIGRIDRGPEATDSVPANVGTGFLISPTVLVTNRHVLEILSVGTMVIERGMAVVNFWQEKDSSDGGDPAALVRVLAVHPSLDLAVFEIEPPPAAADRTPLVIETNAPAAGSSVVAVGYPFADAERNPLFVDMLFESSYGVKRASPGEVIGLGREAVYHDCSTLGGSSGSPLLDMATARIVGVHARGGFAVRNTAVPGAALAELVAPFS